MWSLITVIGVQFYYKYKHVSRSIYTTDLQLLAGRSLIPSIMSSSETAITKKKKSGESTPAPDGDHRKRLFNFLFKL